MLRTGTFSDMTPPLPGPAEGLNGAVAAELRAERAAQNMTLQQLAEAADVPFPSLRRYLAGERHIDVSVLEAVAAALSLDAFEIVRRAGARAAVGPKVNKGDVILLPSVPASSVLVTSQAEDEEDQPLSAVELLDVNARKKRSGHKPHPSSFEDAGKAARDEDRETPRID